jgi:hypothetical protein
MQRCISSSSLGPYSGTDGTDTLARFRCQPWGSLTSGSLTLSFSSHGFLHSLSGTYQRLRCRLGSRQRALAALGNPQAGAPEDASAGAPQMAGREACGRGARTSSFFVFFSQDVIFMAWAMGICGDLCGTDGRTRQVIKSWPATAHAGPRAFAGAEAQPTSRQSVASA